MNPASCQWTWQNVSTRIVLGSVIHSALFPGLNAKPVPVEMAFTNLFDLFVAFLMSSVPAVFTPHKQNVFHLQYRNNMNFRWTKMWKPPCVVMLLFTREREARTSVRTGSSRYKHKFWGCGQTKPFRTNLYLYSPGSCVEGGGRKIKWKRIERQTKREGEK